MDKTLITADGSLVEMTGDAASNCNVFWQVGSSATLGTNSKFQGNILADQAITLTTGAKVYGRALARSAAVTLHNNIVDASMCGASTAVPGGPTASYSWGYTHGDGSSRYSYSYVGPEWRLP